jgi:hypothetical protein
MSGRAPPSLKSKARAPASLSDSVAAEQPLLPGAVPAKDPAPLFVEDAAEDDEEDEDDVGARGAVAMANSANTKAASSSSPTSSSSSSPSPSSSRLPHTLPRAINLSLDVVCAATVSEVVSAVEREWQRLLLLREAIQEAQTGEREAAKDWVARAAERIDRSIAAIATSTATATSPSTATQNTTTTTTSSSTTPLVSVVSLVRADSGARVTDADLASIKGTGHLSQIEVLATFSLAAETPVSLVVMALAADDLAVERGVARDPKARFVRVVRMPRFDLAFLFRRDPALDAQLDAVADEARAMGRDLREIAAGLFWDVFKLLEAKEALERAEGEGSAAVKLAGKFAKGITSLGAGVIGLGKRAARSVTQASNPSASPKLRAAAAAAASSSSVDLDGSQEGPLGPSTPLMDLQNSRRRMQPAVAVSEALRPRLTRDLMAPLWRVSKPTFLDFPFCVDLPLPHSRDAVPEALSEALISLAREVPLKLRPMEWEAELPPAAEKSRAAPNASAFASAAAGTPGLIPFKVSKVLFCLEKKDPVTGEKTTERAPEFEPGSRCCPVIFKIVGAEKPNRDPDEDVETAATAPAPRFKGGMRAFVHVLPPEELGGRPILRILSLRVATSWGIVSSLEALGHLEDELKPSLSEEGAAATEQRRELEGYTAQLVSLARAVLTGLKRERLLAELREVGLYCKPEVTDAHRLLLVTAPNSILERRAEALGLMMPVAPHPATGRFIGGFVKGMFLRSGPLQRFWRRTPINTTLYYPYFSYPDADDPSSFFTQSQRLRLVVDCIESPEAVFNPELGTRVAASGGAGLDLRELAGPNGVADDCLFLHDHHELESTHLSALTTFSAGETRAYFGEQIAFYFILLRSYTLFLLIPAVLGIVVLFFGDPAMIEWFTGRQGAAGGLDGQGHVPSRRYVLVIYAFAIALSATGFTEFFKRRQAYVAYLWGLSASDIEERKIAQGGQVRPEFVWALKKAFDWKAKAKLLRSTLFPTKEVQKEMVSDRSFSSQSLHTSLEHYSELHFYPNSRRLAKMAAGFGLSAALIALLVYIIYVVFVLTLSGRETTLLTRVIAGVLNGLGIPVLNALYKILAIRLTKWEFQRTDAAYESSLLAKLFFFRFVNGYASLFFIAFIAREIRLLATQLASILITGAIVNNAIEIVGPMVARWRKKREDKKLGRGGASEAPEPSTYAEVVELTHDLDSYDDIALAEDYLELVLQFGYVTFFVVAFPVAPLLGFINNVFEFRVDSFGLKHQSRRPYPEPATGIGSWLTIFEFLAVVAVITNVLLVGVTDQDRLLEASRTLCGSLGVSLATWPCRDTDYVWIIVIIEHALLVAKFALASAIPTESSAIQADRHRQLYFERVESDYYAREAEAVFHKKKKQMDKQQREKKE